VLTLHAYFDESGTHADSDAVTVAGYISTAEQWELYTRDWTAALAEWRLTTFHMTDFANGVGPFRFWTEEERRFRFARLIRIINDHVIASVGIAVPMRAFDQIFPKPAKRFIGGAYGLAATCCFMDSARILASSYPSARIAYVFEAGAPGVGEVSKVFRWNYNDRGQRPKYKLLSLEFADKTVLPLQAADILAYELYKYFPHQIGLAPGHGMRREDLVMLSECKLRSWGRLDEPELFKWAAVAKAGACFHTHSGERRSHKRTRNNL